MTKTIIITGATGNLGQVLVKRFLDLDYEVIATLINEDAAKELLPNERLKTVVVDLADEQKTNEMVEKLISEYKNIDAAVMLAGGFSAGNIFSTDASVLKKLYTLNFETAYYLTRPLFNHMTRNNYGRLIYIGARPALDAKSGKDLLPYALSKSLLFTLSAFLNEEAKGMNVTSTVIVPSTIDTPANRKSMPGVNPENWVTTEQLADCIEFILSAKGEALRETVLKVYNNV